MRQAYVRSRLEDAVGFDDVRVCEHLQDFQLFLDVGYGGLVACLAGLDHVDLAVLLADRFPQHSSATLAERLHHRELLFEGDRSRGPVSLFLCRVPFALGVALSVLSVLFVVCRLFVDA